MKKLIIISIISLMNMSAFAAEVKQRVEIQVEATSPAAAAPAAQAESPAVSPEGPGCCNLFTEAVKKLGRKKSSAAGDSERKANADGSGIASPTQPMPVLDSGDSPVTPITDHQEADTERASEALITMAQVTYIFNPEKHHTPRAESPKHEITGVFAKVKHRQPIKKMMPLRIKNNIIDVAEIYESLISFVGTEYLGGMKLIKGEYVDGIQRPDKYVDGIQRTDKFDLTIRNFELEHISGEAIEKMAANKNLLDIKFANCTLENLPDPSIIQIDPNWIIYITIKFK